MLFASVPADGYEFTAGQRAVRHIASSSFGHRAFCGECGTPLYMKVDHQPESIDFSLATLDRPERIRPGFHIFWASRLPWIVMNDGLPKFDRFRPHTRGLAGTEPPDNQS